VPELFQICPNLFQAGASALLSPVPTSMIPLVGSFSDFETDIQYIRLI